MEAEPRTLRDDWRVKPLSARAFNSLANAGFTSVEQILVVRDARRLDRVRGIGRKTLMEIYAFLREVEPLIKRKFCMDVPPYK